MSLQIIGAGKQYGAVNALADVSLELQEGRVHAILGPSGSGKTTLLHAVSGLERLDHGTIRWDGRVFQDTLRQFLPPERRQVGMVFQDFALFPHMTVGQNIAFGLGTHKWSKNRVAQRIGELLTLLHLEGLADRFPHELSGGQKQRTAVARALAPGPSLLLLDESLSSLDAALRRMLQQELRELFSRLRLTVVLVTHDPLEALVMADNIAVMNQGQVVSVGSPRSLYSRPENSVVAQLMGLVSLWPGQVVSASDNAVMVDVMGRTVAVSGATMPVGTSVTMVIRPTACHPAGNREAAFEVRVDHVRYLGDQYLVAGRCGDATLNFYLDYEPGPYERVGFKADKVWCFPAAESTRNPEPEEQSLTVSSR